MEETKKSSVTSTGWEISHFSDSPKEILKNIRKERTLRDDSSVSIDIPGSVDLDRPQINDLGVLFLYKLGQLSDKSEAIKKIVNSDRSYKITSWSKDHIQLKEESIETLIDLMEGIDDLYPLFDQYRRILVDSQIVIDVRDYQDDLNDPNTEKFKKSTESARDKMEDEEVGEGDYEEEDGEEDDESEGKAKSRESEKEQRETPSYKYSDEERRPFRYESVCKIMSKEVKVELREGNEKMYMSASEVYNQKMFSDMLDISFESKPALVQSLRTGKLDIAKISESLVGNFNIYERMEEEQDTRPFSVCILMDESGSMSGGKRQMQYSMVKSLYKSFEEVLPPEKIFVYGHTSTNPYHDDSDDYRDKILFNVYNEPSHLKFEKAIPEQKRINFQQNYDSMAVEEVYKRVRGVTSDRMILIVTSDGQPGGIDYGGWAANEELKRVIEKCKRDEFITVGIGIQDNNVQEIYQYSTVVRDLSTFPKLVARLLTDVIKQEFKD